MRCRRRLSLVIAAAMSAALAQVPATATTVTAAQRVDPVTNEVVTHWGPALAVDPADPAHLVAVHIERVGLNTTYGTCLASVSRDAGGTWRSVTLPLPAGWACRKLPPKIVFGKDGAVHAAYYGQPTGTSRLSAEGQLIVATSSDGGASFLRAAPVARDPMQTAAAATGVPVTIIGGSGTIPPAFTLAADREHGMVYAGWVMGLPGLVWISRSVDDARSFQAPVLVTYPVHDPTGVGTVYTRPALAAAGGRVFLAFTCSVCGSTENRMETAVVDGNLWWRSAMFSVSTDRGQTFAAPRRLADYPYYDGGVPSTPSIAADFAGGRTRVYIAYDDTLEAPTSKNVYLLSSMDAGATWRSPVRLPDDPIDAGFPHERPSISVAPDGRVDAAWYDGREDPWSPQSSCPPSGVCQGRDVYYTYSTDGGRTFARNVRITPATFGASTRTLNASGKQVDVLGALGLASAPHGPAFAWEHSGDAAPVAVAGGAPREVTQWHIYATRAVVER